MNGEDLPEFLAESPNFTASTDDIFSILEAFENSCGDYDDNIKGSSNGNGNTPALNASKDEYSEEPIEDFEFQNSFGNYSPFQESETEVETCASASVSANSSKRQKVTVSKRQKVTVDNYVVAASSAAGTEDGQQNKISHITVERNRRKQMNEHLGVLRALMPCFYVKRGDQASIIGGVVNYITELQQILQSLEAKKQRKAYADSLSPRVISSPRPSPHHPSTLSPRRPPLSPRLNLPISPRTPQPSNPYKPRLHTLQQSGFLHSPSLPNPVDLSPCNSSTSSINDAINELVASSKTAVAEVEVKFSGPNLLLKTASHRVRGQALKIISVLQELALEILQMNISAVDETMLYSFTIKIGIDCQLSAEELAEQIQQTFC